MSTTPDDVKNPQSEHHDVARGARTLHRPASGRVLAGVAAGFAGYSGVDVTIIRVAFAVLTVIGITGLSYFGWLPLYLFGVPLYLAGWLVIPEEGSDRSIAATMLHWLQTRSR
jgi:phage shock protein PspC (stress-responsive transcriptional regulator)